MSQTAQEQVESLVNQIAEQEKQKAEWEALTQHSQFQAYQRELRLLNRSKLVDVVEGLDCNLDSLIATNVIKSQVAGTAFALEYPQRRAEDFAHTIKLLRDELATLEEDDDE